MTIQVGDKAPDFELKDNHGATVKLSMTIAGEQLQLEAAVAWVREGAVGLRFLFASPEQRERLERLVSGLSGEAPSGAPPSRPR